MSYKVNYVVTEESGMRIYRTLGEFSIKTGAMQAIKTNLSLFMAIGLLAEFFMENEESGQSWQASTDAPEIIEM